MNTSVSTSKHAVNLKTRVALGFVLLAVLVSGLTLTVVFINFRTQLRSSLRQRLANIVSLAALQQDGDDFQTIQSSSDPEYQQVWAQNTAILESDPDLVFIYTMRYDDAGLYFVVDAGDQSSDLFSPYGLRYEYPGEALATNYLTMTEPISEDDFYTDEYGSFLSAYAPILDSKGEKVGIIGADMSANKIIASERQLLLITLAIFAGSLPIIALVGWLLGNNLASPIESLSKAAIRISQGDLSYRPEIKASIPEITNLGWSFTSMADQLKNLISELEERVAKRTADLQTASDEIQSRASQLQTIAEIAHSVSLVQDIEQILESIARIISDKFGFYHIGIFLLDSNREYAVLRATNSSGGKKMLARGHRLKVGEVGIVGFAAGSSKPRIALDVGKDAVFFNNPDLPETRSEMALPLLIRGDVIGILDIQSKVTSAFQDRDFDVFHILADQVAIAIENARLYSATRQALAQAEKSYAEMIRTDWAQFTQSRKDTAVLFSSPDQSIQAVSPAYPEISQVIDTGRTIVESNETSKLAVPLKLRGELIGILDIRIPSNYSWTNEELDMVQRIADRAALSLDIARLYEETRLRETKEHLIGDISSKISTSINLKSVLQTAVEELGQALPGSEIEIRLGPKQR